MVVPLWIGVDAVNCLAFVLPIYSSSWEYGGVWSRSSLVGLFCGTELTPCAKSGQEFVLCKFCYCNNLWSIHALSVVTSVKSESGVLLCSQSGLSAISCMCSSCMFFFSYRQIYNAIRNMTKLHPIMMFNPTRKRLITKYKYVLYWLQMWIISKD